MWYLAKFYTASEAEKMGLVNIVVPVSLFLFLWIKKLVYLLDFLNDQNKIAALPILDDQLRQFWTFQKEKMISNLIDFWIVLMLFPSWRS